MGDQDSVNSLPPVSAALSGNSTTEIHIPQQLKFLISNIKNLVPNALTTDNYAIWRLQLLQQFTANGYAGHLNGTSPCPTDATSQDFQRWQLADNNLLSALFSTISPSLLPYIISCTSTHAAWLVLERRLQPTCRNRVIQLKNELHHVQMQNLTMQQYLNHVKVIVDNIAAAGSNVDAEDVILHILNGLPAAYNPFKAAIRTSPLPMSLDNLYSLLCSEEIIVNQEISKESSTAVGATALYATSINQSRNRPPRKFGKTRTPPVGQTLLPANSTPVTPNSASANMARPTCQICNKIGHIALNCWHRSNPRFAPTNSRSMNAFLAQQNQNSSQDWILDSGASNHLTPDLSNLHYPANYQGTDNVSIANGSQLPVVHSGQGLLPLPDTPRKIYLRKLLHVPHLSHNLLSVSQLTTDNPISISFDANGFQIKDRKDHRLLLRGPLRDGLYHLQRPIIPKPTALHATTNQETIWHARLGHPHHGLLKHLLPFLPDINHISNKFSCASCTMSKCHKSPFNKNNSVSHAAFDLIHSDVWGPAPVNSLDGFRYYVIFVDDFTRFSWLYLMTSKQETISKFRLFHQLIQTQFNITPKAFRSDGGGEFTSHEFNTYLQSHGIQRQLSCPHTPEQNGLAERKHRHLLDLARTMMHAANLPINLWAEAIATANYLVNRLPSSAILNQTPFYRLHGHHPNYTHLRTFGCQCFPWLRPYTANKLLPRSQECTFIGYSPVHKGYKCLNSYSNKIFISRHVTFNETCFPFKTTLPKSINTPSNYTPPLVLIPPSLATNPTPSTVHTTTQITHPVTPTTQQSPASTQNSSNSSMLPTVSAQPIPNPPSHHMQTRLKSGIIKPKHILSLFTSAPTDSTPKTYAQAIKHPHWRQAMSEEFHALQKQSTWTLVPAPAQTPILGCKWTFKTKLLPNGQVDRYKARLVAQGYDQQYGVNYTETFSPVAKMTTIRILLTLALNRNWEIRRLDVSNAFLHGDLSETVYMRQPPGFVDTTSPSAVCKLNKSLYGLKQAPRQWFEKLTTFLQHQGFRFTRSDPSLLTFRRNTIQIFLLIYVDDILITGNDHAALTELLSTLHKHFALKQLSQLSLFLGIQIIRQPTGLFLTQQHYAEKLLKEFGLADCKAAETPLSPKSKDNNTPSLPFSDPSLYRRLAGSLQYLSITRPDIAFATNQACQHMHQPTTQDFQALKRLLRYIKGTVSYGLPITTGDLTLRTYTDADWASDSSDRKSISGFCTFLGPNLVSWTVKKQVTVAKSSTEAEYRSLSAATSDVIWLRRLVEELDLPQSSPTPIYCDNTSAIAIARNPVFHARTKHIEIDYQFIRQHIKNGAISITHISSDAQIADILTKSFSIARFQNLRHKLTIRSPNG
ncbi:Retrovirus-related Pol polyprotein from transposon TNT 1-94 [Dendrobium catenatum]|uniref:Retrovirus-related Pol polyprotein from transposon TNT 1-94 n=1 Tax=Dendrobium catenatum TaxID=906689 RepID=A0A2I0WSK7_9ASPA|nr:Retrovirus-related Pol polyprotein from transposon TNT 1-94 [Dendrobium catenatum]